MKKREYKSEYDSCFYNIQRNHDLKHGEKLIRLNLINGKKPL